MSEGPAFDRLQSWSGDGIDIGDVSAALDRLRRLEARTATRSSVVTLVAVAPDKESADTASAALHRLGARHPGRTVVVVADPSGAAGIDASVALHGGESEGIALWSDDVRLTVRGDAARHLDSLVEPLTLPDLPVALWYVSALPAPGDPLLGMADTVLVDARQMGGPDGEMPLADLVDLSRRSVVIDLSWVRLRPWREVTARLFDGAFLPFATAVREVSVEGRPGPSRLLAGWLAERLAVNADNISVSPAQHVSLHLTAERDGQRAEFTIRREHGQKVVHAVAEIEGGAQTRQLLGLPDDSLPWSLGVALTSLEADRTYLHALGAALTLR